MDFVTVCETKMAGPISERSVRDDSNEGLTIKPFEVNIRNFGQFELPATKTQVNKKSKKAFGTCQAGENRMSQAGVGFRRIRLNSDY